MAKKKEDEAPKGPMQLRPFQKRILQIHADGTNGYISNAFGIGERMKMTTPHLFPKSVDRVKTNKDIRIIENEVTSKLFLDEKGRPCIMARSICDNLYWAVNLQPKESGIKMSKKEFHVACKVTGIDNIHYVPLSWKSYRTRADNVIMKDGKGGLHNMVAFRPEFIGWSINFNIIFMPGLISESAIITAIAFCSEFVGLGAWTPRFSGGFGLFSTTNPNKNALTKDVSKQTLDRKTILGGLKQFLKDEKAPEDMMKKWAPLIAA